MSLFHFAVRRLRWLARVPLAPQWFDAMLLAWTSVWHRERLSAMEAVEAAALEIPGVVLTAHRFGGIGFSRNGRELGHLHGNGLLDVFAGVETARELIAAGRAEPHHFFPNSAWISFWLRSSADVPNAVALLRIPAQRLACLNA